MVATRAITISGSIFIDQTLKKRTTEEKARKVAITGLVDEFGQVRI